MSELPLSGLTVVELFAIGPVPFAGLQLQQLGAEVLRILPPKDRGIGIGIDAQSDLLNHGKSDHHIHLKTAAGLAELHSLLADADVLMEGFRPGVLERLGLDPARLTAEFPKLVIGRLSGFGRHGPYAARAGHDINYLALSGALSSIGSKNEPIVPLNLVADFGGGAMYLLVGILAKLVQRGIHGRGGVAETSILAGTLGLTPMFHSLMAADRWTLNRQSNLLDGGAPFYRVYQTRDKRFVAVGALEPPFFKNLLILTGLEEEFSLENQYEEQHWPTMRKAFSSAFAKRSRDEWAVAAIALDCCVTPVLDFTEALLEPHHRDNGWILDAPFPHPGPVLDFPPDKQ